MATINSPRGKDSIVETLAGTIAAWSLSTTSALLSEMYEVLEEEGMTPEQDYNLHMEMLTFFLLNFERYALVSGGEEFLDLINDETANKAVNLVLDKVDSTAQNNRKEKIFDALDYYNQAAEDYDSCQILVDKKPDYEGSCTVLGKLSTRIASALDKPPIPEVIDMVSVVAAEALVESELKKKVVKASSLTGK